MPKSKRPVPRKSAGAAHAAAEPDHDGLAQNLVDLALEITEREDADPSTVAAREQEVQTLVRRALRRRHDDTLYGAIELALLTDPDACRYLRATIEEEAATLQVRSDARDGEAPAEFEIDCFMMPLFVRSTGGLKADEIFRDDAAFEELGDSLRQAGLASVDTRIVLVRHLYDIDAVDRIRFSELQEMLREAAATMRSKKLVGAPAIEASMRAWQGVSHGPEDDALELRFLLGFAMKRADDPFYRVPGDEDGADAYYEGRMARYRMWAGGVAPLLARSLSAHPAEIDINFLYQDLFYGAKEQGLGELAMLATLAGVNARLDDLGREPERLKAVVAPFETDDELVLRINLYPLDGGAPLATIDKPLDLSADVETELEDLCDGLGTVGLDGVLVASGFDEHGEPEGAQAYLSD
jgi:hypothetical protein